MCRAAVGPRLPGWSGLEPDASAMAGVAWNPPPTRGAQQWVRAIPLSFHLGAAVSRRECGDLGSPPGRHACSPASHFSGPRPMSVTEAKRGLRRTPTLPLRTSPRWSQVVPGRRSPAGRTGRCSHDRGPAARSRGRVVEAEHQVGSSFRFSHPRTPRNSHQAVRSDQSIHEINRFTKGPSQPEALEANVTPHLQNHQRDSLRVARCSPRRSTTFTAGRRSVSRCDG